MIDFVVMMWSTLRSQKNRKPKNWLSLENGLNQENLEAKKWKSVKSGNWPKFYITKAGPRFLTPKAKIAFNCLWLAFIKSQIFGHFDLECHI